jgi:hypothetical protein
MYFMERVRSGVATVHEICYTPNFYLQQIRMVNEDAWHDFVLAKAE